MGRTLNIPKCMRCGAPGNAAVAGGRLRRITRYRARRRVGRSRSRHRDNRRAVPYGFVHEDLAYCERRMPNARRRPQDPEVWG